MKDWQIFEHKVQKLLTKKFKSTDLIFKSAGGSDSTESDIKIYRNGDEVKSIEVKLCPCQSGQIVILPIDGEFKLSSKSIYKDNPYSNKILNHMNSNFTKYNRVSTKGINLTCDDSIFFNWIEYHYKNHKNSDFIIAGNLDKDKNIDYINFIPINQISKFFSVESPYRIKKSGTSDLIPKYEDEFRENFTKLSKAKSFNIINCYRKNDNSKKLYIEIDMKLTGSDLYLVCDNFTSYLSYKKIINGNYKYEVRKRSTTNNPNIVYKLDLLKNVPSNTGNDLLEDYLTKL